MELNEIDDVGQRVDTWQNSDACIPVGVPEHELLLDIGFRVPVRAHPGKSQVMAQSLGFLPAG